MIQVPDVAPFYKWFKENNIINIMNPQQKQMLNMMYASTSKSEEELNKMTPEEKKEYLRSRLHQKMNIGGLQRRTNFQKTQIQEKLQGNTGEEEEAPKAKSKSAKKNEKERMKKLAELLQNPSVPEEVKRIKSESESDYESDKDEN
jgi:hypothetical protein